MPLNLDRKTMNKSHALAISAIFPDVLVSVGRRTFCDSSTFRDSEILSHFYEIDSAWPI